MSVLVWDALGARFYDAGIDRCVLYLPGKTGVAWNGVTGVNEKPSGAEEKAYYIDGFKYYHMLSRDEYQATLDAYAAPVEFQVCDGIGIVVPGLLATQQPRKPFHLSYRTTVGNDDLFEGFGYQIHIVYNCLAKPSNRTYKTRGANPEVTPRSWDIISRADQTPYEMAPTAHFIIDSRTAPAAKLQNVEKVLYGTADTSARMPSQNELMALMV